MSIYEVNLNAMEKNKFYLKELISQKENIKYQSMQFSTCDTKLSDVKSLVVQTENKNLRLNSIYNPLEEACIWADQFNYNNMEIVAVIFGLGNGIFVRELKNRLQEETITLIYEPSIELFEFVLNHYDISEILEDEKVILYVGTENREDFERALGSCFDWKNIQSQIITKHPHYDKIFIEQYRDFLQDVNDNNERTIVNCNTESFFGKKLIEHVISNLGEIKRANTIDEYFGKFPENVPAIIVSAGPSLEKNIQDLKEAKGKAVIFVTDSAINYVLARDVIPDFIVCLDSNKADYHFSNPKCKDIPFICCIEGNPRVIKEQKGRLILFSSYLFPDKFVNSFGKQIPKVYSGGSVATGALSICAYLNFKQIILIGQDLAYGEKGTHVGGVTKGYKEYESSTRMIEGWNGELIKTRLDWYVYLKWFERFIPLLEQVNVINATEGGAKIKGTTMMSLKEAIKTYCVKQIDCNVIVENTPMTFTNNEVLELKNKLVHCKVELNEIAEKNKNVISLCEKVIKACKNKQSDSKYTQKMIQNIVQLNQEVEGTFVYEMIDLYIMSEVSAQLKNMYKRSSDEQENFVNAFKETKTMHELIFEATNKLKIMIETELESHW